MKKAVFVFCILFLAVSTYFLLVNSSSVLAISLIGNTIATTTSSTSTHTTAITTQTTTIACSDFSTLTQEIEITTPATAEKDLPDKIATELIKQSHNKPPKPEWCRLAGSTLWGTARTDCEWNDSVESVFPSYSGGKVTGTGTLDNTMGCSGEKQYTLDSQSFIIKGSVTTDVLALKLELLKPFFLKIIDEINKNRKNFTCNKPDCEKEVHNLDIAVFTKYDDWWTIPIRDAATWNKVDVSGSYKIVCVNKIATGNYIFNTKLKLTSKCKTNAESEFTHVATPVPTTASTSIPTTSLITELSSTFPLEQPTTFRESRMRRIARSILGFLKNMGNVIFNFD